MENNERHGRIFIHSSVVKDTHNYTRLFIIIEADFDSGEKNRTSFKELNLLILAPLKRVSLMLFIMFLKGLLIGFIIALPFGPIGIMCVQHSVIRGMSYGLIAGLGAALADALYGALAGFGVSSISAEFIETNKIILEVIGAAFLCFLGIRSFFSQPKTVSEVQDSESFKKIFAGTFFLTLANPFTLLCLAGIYTGLGICLSGEGVMATLVLSLGVFVGSAFWWILISFGMSFFKNKMDLRWVGNINRISGIVLICFGIAASLAIVQQVMY